VTRYQSLLQEGAAWGYAFSPVTIAVRALKEKSTTRIQQTVQRVITDIFMEKIDNYFSFLVNTIAYS